MSNKTLSPMRQRLAAAIENLNAAERDLAVATAAAETANDKAWEAKADAEAAQDFLGKARPDTAKFLRSFTNGDAADLVEIERPVAEAQRALDLAERGVAHWRSLADDLKSEVTGRTHAVDKGKLALKAAVDAVVRAEADVSTLLDGLAELEAEVVARRAALRTLARSHLISDEMMPRVKAALPDVASPLPTITYSPPDYHELPTVKAWLAAFDALHHDAAAPLPGVGNR